MISITLKTNEWSLQQRFELMELLYLEILEDDPHWHFFYEMEMGDFLRVGDEFGERVDDFLRQYPVEFEFTGEWVEDMEFVKKNISYFRDLFHINSVFAVTYNDDEDYLIKNLFYWVDRYSHSLHNTLHLALGKDMSSLEVRNLSSATIARSWYDGYRAYYLQNKKFFKENNNADNSEHNDT